MDEGDGEPKIDMENLQLKYNIAQLIFPCLPVASIADTINMIKNYTVNHVIGFNDNPILATQLYTIFENLP